MYKIKNLWILAILALAISSCRKDTIDFIEGPKGQDFQSNILGSVIDEAGQPVANATVKYLGVTKTSDENGVYYFKNVKVNSKHSLITIRKEGYFEASRVFTTDRSNTVRVRNTLLAKTFDQSFESAAGATLKKGAITLDFPADAVIVASNNTPYSGTVQIAMKYLNPDGVEIFNQMPGTLAGINSANQIAVMTTYGMVAVELQSPSGQLLQVAPGKKVKMSNKLSSSILSKAPSTIPLWYYDETLGYWKEEGEAKLINDTYVGEVAHFTYWNYDAQAPAITLSGRLVDQFGNPIANAHIYFIDPSIGGGGHGNTNGDGTFSGLVTANAVLNVTATILAPGCNYTEIYNGQVGPFASDVNIGDIVANLASVDNVTFTAQAVNCGGAPVTDGYVKVKLGSISEYFEVNNGAVSGAVVHCGGNSDVTFKVLDRESGMESATLTYAVTQFVDLGTVNVCANQADFIKVEVPDLGINTILYDDLSINVNLNGNMQHINSGHGVDSTQALKTAIYWNFSSTGAVVPGEYTIVDRETYLAIPNQNIYKRLSGLTGTVKITQGGSQPGDKVIGTYNYISEVQGTIIEHEVSGSFQLTIE